MGHRSYALSLARASRRVQGRCAGAPPGRRRAAPQAWRHRGLARDPWRTRRASLTCRPGRGTARGRRGRRPWRGRPSPARRPAGPAAVARAPSPARRPAGPAAVARAPVSRARAGRSTTRRSLRSSAIRPPAAKVTPAHRAADLRPAPSSSPAQARPPRL